MFALLKKLSQISVSIALVTVSFSSFAEDQAIANIFKKYGAQGTMIISESNKNITYVHNDKRANKRLSPASTFKIPNSLIAIEEEVLTDQSEMIPWDGTKRFLEAWNADQNLKSAFKASCVWFYQEVAKKVGNDKYIEYLKMLNYGNQKTGKDVTTFWLGGQGDLKISPLEKIEFLKNVYQKKYSISERNYNILQDIMLEESHENYNIYSKTGAATQDWVGHGWYVGYVTIDNKVWFFATNILINGFEDLKLRKEVTIASLKEKGII